jgi:hypothetical protein
MGCGSPPAEASPTDGRPRVAFGGSWSFCGQNEYNLLESRLRVERLEGLVF